MTADITPLIAGNWKMNGTSAAIGEIKSLGEKLSLEPPRCTIVVCPPATLLERLSAIGALLGICTGGQDCHHAPNGAHTGDLSAPMLADAGAQFVIVGHSERRTDYAETDDIVRLKANAAMGAGLIPIICVGETEADREAGNAEAVVKAQLATSVPDEWRPAGIVVAYEPVWAIGTGRTPTSAEIAEMHGAIRADLEARFGEAGRRTRILYGGSVKPANANEIMRIDNVNGALVGGASLLANDFHAIISAV